MAFSNLRLKTKLLLGFAAMAVVVLLVSLFALRSLGVANHRFTDYLDGVSARERMANDIRSVAMRRAIAARNLVLVTAPADREVERLAVVAAHEEMARHLGTMKTSLADPARGASDADRALFARIEDVEAKYGPVALNIVQLALDGKRDDAIAKMNAECRPLLAALLKATTDYIDDAHKDAEMLAAGAEAAQRTDRTGLLVASALGVCVAVVLSFVISGAVTAPLVRAVSLARAVASGDLSTRIEVDRDDETGQLLLALKTMNDSLSGIVDGVRHSADEIATATSEIASGNQHLSSRTEQQASALQQTAASMQQMTSTVQNNAASSSEASHRAQAAAAVAHRGSEVVGRVVATMDEISDASKRIADIIGVIDGIAFQTNILALNAAVEAARAGEQGRGFAVVAAEVRGLAQRSAGAAKEIKQLIANSVDKVGAGSALVHEAGRTMGEIVDEVRRVTGLVGGISASSAEQRTGIEQVNEAVASIDRTTQQNAALVEQSAAAALSVKQQAAALLASISHFKMRGQEPA